MNETEKTDGANGASVPKKEGFFRRLSRPADLTGGTPWKVILLYAAPIMLSYLLQQIYVLTDAMTAGTPAQNGYGAATKLINFLMAFYNGLGSAILGYNAQNYGSGNYRRIKKGTLQTLAIMLVIFAFCFAAGMLLSIGGAYQYIFMSEDKISAESIRFGNAYIYVDISLYFVLGFLIVVRSAVQGICKPSYVLGAGVTELVARIFACAFLPVLVNGGEITSSASHAAFVALCFGDPFAWFTASVLLCVPLVKYILLMKYKTPGKNPAEITGGAER